MNFPGIRQKVDPSNCDSVSIYTLQLIRIVCLYVLGLLFTKLQCPKLMPA